jgi:PBP1b-binding outer membrane lipoprotein LpoB
VITQTTPKTLLALTTAALLLAGCGGSSGSGDVSTSSAAAPAMTGAPQMSDQQAPPERVVIDVTLRNGQVTPTNEQLKGKVGDPIVVKINSDAVDQLHIHSNPEHTFDVAAKVNQSFQFTVAVPGKVDVELHEMNRTIATIDVQ